MVTNIPNVQNWTVTPQNGQPGYFTLMNTWLGQSTLVVASLQTAIVAQNKANSEINALAIQAENNAIIANGLANFQGAWSGLVPYLKGQSVESTAGSKIYYISKVDNNLNHLVTDTNYWLYNPINDKINKVTTPTTNALAKINADGTIGNSTITIDDNGVMSLKKIDISSSSNGTAENIIRAGVSGVSNGLVVRKDNVSNMFLEYFKQDNGLCLKIDSAGNMQTPYVYNNTTASAANIFMDSTGKIFRSTSSRQYKKSIETIDKSYVDIFFDKARPIYYKSLSENDNPNWGYWGFIAEEIAEFDKRLVHWRYQTKDIEVEKERVLEDETIEKYTEIETINDESKPMIAEGVMYERITVLLTAKVQEQQKVIDSLLSRIERLESGNTTK